MENKFSLNQIVWAKLSGYPWWPASIKSRKGNKFEVYFFDEFGRSYLNSNKIREFEDKNCYAKNPGRKLKTSIQAAERVLNNDSTIELEILKAERKFDESVRSSRKNSKDSFQSINSDQTNFDESEKCHFKNSQICETNDTIDEENSIE